jgi:hypothetical protein
VLIVASYIISYCMFICDLAIGVSTVRHWNILECLYETYKGKGWVGDEEKAVAL